MRKFMAAVTAVALLAGCSTHSENRSPKELLSLAVSGLTGVDHYRFEGSTGISVKGGGEKPVTFQGTVKDHNDIKVQTSSNAKLPGIGHPLELLKDIEASARSTELVTERSGNRTAVLHIDADEAKAKKQWSDRIRGEFARLEQQVPAMPRSAVKQAGAGKDPRQAAFEREWKDELARSRSKLDRMLKTLKVKSSYTLIVDRTKLLPIRLQEHTELRYTADGAEQQELRKTDMRFATSGR